MGKSKSADGDTDLGRRAFFRRGLDQTAKTLTKGADALAKSRARHWIRPPYALDELDFLLTCTRCGACKDACPHQLIFPLPARLGAQVVATPAMDLLNKGCRLCTDWPCVAACEPGALKRSAEEKDGTSPLPRLAEARIDTASCLPYSGPECGACAASCGVPRALLWDRGRPLIDSTNCIGCAMCREACIVEPKAISIHALSTG